MYKYKLLNNHYVVEIDDKHYILDTGYPYSITFRSDLNMVNKNEHDFVISVGFSTSDSLKEIMTSNFDIVCEELDNYDDIKKLVFNTNR